MKMTFQLGPKDALEGVYEVTPPCHLKYRKKNETMPCAATGMDLEMIILSEVSQTERKIDTIRYHLHVESRK